MVGRKSRVWVEERWVFLPRERLHCSWAARKEQEDRKVGAPGEARGARHTKAAGSLRTEPKSQEEDWHSGLPSPSGSTGERLVAGQGQRSTRLDVGYAEHHPCLLFRVHPNKDHLPLHAPPAAAAWPLLIGPRDPPDGAGQSEAPS